MYYTRKGDSGTSNLVNPKNRITKSDLVFEVLGSLDELNSWLGLCAVEAKNISAVLEIIKNIQNQLFICQAYFAGAEIVIPANLVSTTEEIIDELGKSVPMKKSFVISGGVQLSALFDVARTLARKTERRAVGLQDITERQLNSLVLTYLNRLSSLLYVLARFVNAQAEQEEEAPKY